MPFFAIPVLIITDILFIVIAVVGVIGLFNKDFLVKWIKFGNELRGTTTKITPLTLKVMRVNCVLMIVMGIFFFFFFLGGIIYIFTLANFLPKY